MLPQQHIISDANFSDTNNALAPNPDSLVLC